MGPILSVFFPQIQYAKLLRRVISPLTDRNYFALKAAISAISQKKLHIEPQISS